MDLQASFGELFFKQWQSTGLPDPQPYLNEYIDLREHGDVYEDWMHSSHPYSSALNGNQLRSVYGFGAVIGKLYSELIGLNEAQTKKTADWCGKFNLGISLFDFISDEMNAASQVAALTVFQPFHQKGIVEAQQQSPEESLLSELAASVLLEIQTNPLLLQSMKAMFEAEQFVSTKGIGADADLQEVQKALRLKSAEPFNVMAMYAASFVENIDTSLYHQITRFGYSLGDCYWIMDDAKDLWIDLEENHWNYFLLEPIATMPQFFTAAATEKRDLLQQYWEKTNQGEVVAMQMIQQLKAAITPFQLDANRKHRLEGLIGASLWQWYYY